MLDKIRVMHLTYTLEGGGTEQQLVYLLNGIDASNFENAVLSVVAQGQQPITSPVTFFEVPRAHKWDPRWGGVRAVCQNWKPDIVHVWNPYVLPSSIPAIFNRNVKAIVSSYRSTYRIDSLFNLIHAISLLFVHKIVSNVREEEMYPPFRQLFRLKNGEVIPNGLDLEHIQSAAKIDLESFGINPAQPKILYVGRLIRDKNFSGLLRALSLVTKGDLPGCQLIICGKGSELTSFEEVARALGISDRVFFLGYRRDVFRFMKSCDLLVLPSFIEGMPNVLFEAMAAGLPVIASDISAHRRWIEAGKHGLLFDPHDPGHLARCIEKILNSDREDILRMTENAYLEVSEYSVERMVKRYEVLYRGIMCGESS